MLSSKTKYKPDPIGSMGAQEKTLEMFHRFASLRSVQSWFALGSRPRPDLVSLGPTDSTPMTKVSRILCSVDNEFNLRFALSFCLQPSECGAQCLVELSSLSSGA